MIADKKPKRRRSRTFQCPLWFLSRQVGEIYVELPSGDVDDLTWGLVKDSRVPHPPTLSPDDSIGHQRF